ncbi:hypothetical protein ACTFIY_002964 [Dictyostelium cf. discoideum]
MFLKILIIYFIFLNSFVLSLLQPIKNNNDNTITLIVDPFSNKNQNFYKSGEKCGDNYNRCKSINDAILYFNTIAIAIPNNNKLSYQQLNLQLADGIYSTTNYSFNLFEFNINIEPFNKNSKKVVFDGSNSNNNNNNNNDNNNNALFYVEPVSNTSSLQFKKKTINSSTTSILSSISISDITFISFSNTIIKIDNRNDENYNIININNCIFNNFTSSPQKIEKYGSPIIYLQSSSSPSSVSKQSYLSQNQPQKQQLNINNCVFKSSNLYTSLWKTRLIHIENTNSLMNNNVFHNLNGLKSLLNIIYSRFNSDITMNSNQFHDIVTCNGLINTDNSMIKIINSNFRSIIGNNFGSVLYFTSSSTFPSFTFFIENSNFWNCTSLFSSGVINAVGITNNNDENIINDCNFFNNKGPDSSILSCQTIDITIQYSKLQSINSHGGTFLIYTSNLFVHNNYIKDEINDDSIFDSGRIQTIGKANLTMSSNNFGDDLNHKFKFSCDESIINLQNNQNLIPSFICNQCLDFTINNNNSIC